MISHDKWYLGRYFHDFFILCIFIFHVSQNFLLAKLATRCKVVEDSGWVGKFSNYLLKISSTGACQATQDWVVSCDFDTTFYNEVPTLPSGYKANVFSELFFHQLDPQNISSLIQLYPSFHTSILDFQLIWSIE